MRQFIGQYTKIAICFVHLLKYVQVPALLQLDSSGLGRPGWRGLDTKCKCCLDKIMQMGASATVPVGQCRRVDVCRVRVKAGGRLGGADGQSVMFALRSKAHTSDLLA